MQEYILPILGFITGGGATALVSLRYIKQNTKLDYTDKALQFMEAQESKLLTRFSKLETRVSELEKISCITADCTKRKVAV